MVVRLDPSVCIQAPTAAEWRGDRD
jgi:hypothetical protein